MRESVKTSIVIRTFNSERTIGRVLDAIRGQKFGDHEVVIVDSGSTDDTLEIVRDHPHAFVDYSGRKFTYGGSLNAGCEAARGEYIVCLSSHCIPLHDDWLELLVGALDANERLAGAWGPLALDEGDSPVRERPAQIVDLGAFRRKATWGLQNANSIIRRELWAERAFSEKVERCEDQDWAHHFLKEGFNTSIIYGALVQYAPDYTFLQHALKNYRDAMTLYGMFGYEGSGSSFDELYRETKWLYRATRRGDKSSHTSKLAVSGRVGRWAAGKAIDLKKRLR